MAILFGEAKNDKMQGQVKKNIIIQKQYNLKEYLQTFVDNMFKYQFNIL